jgi:hypothetical protein
MSVTDFAAARIREWVGAWPERPDQGALLRMLRFLGKWRAAMLVNTYIARQGTVVHSGIFRGMTFLDHSTEEGAMMPRLLGTYESELHPHFRAFVEESLDAVIDVGCAEGYYAVGLARMAPSVTVHARDIDEKARTACAELAQRNGVADRVRIGGRFEAEDFQAFVGQRALVLVDAEGAEADILDPVRAPALADMSIIVETHDVFRPGSEALLKSRFSPTHDIVRVEQQPKTFDMPDWMRTLTHLDQLLAVWEFRLAPTPWLVMRPRKPSPQS